MENFKSGSIAAEESTEQRESCTVIHESFLTTVYCVQGNGSEDIKLAVKSLNAMYSDNDDQISRFENEFAISSQLSSQCNSVRSAISMSEFDGFPAILLQW
eukprot:2852867-Ditylum_brightwellii.AAC.1